MQPGQHRRAGPRLARAGRTLLDKIVDPGAAGQEAIGVPAFPPHSLEMADPPSPPAPLGLGANGRAGCVDGARRVFGSLKMGVRERERERAQRERAERERQVLACNVALGCCVAAEAANELAAAMTSDCSGGNAA